MIRLLAYYFRRGNLRRFLTAFRIASCSHATGRLFAGSSSSELFPRASRMSSFTLLVCLLVLAATYPCRAQRLQLGLKAGLLASTSTEPSSRTARTGGVAGGWLLYPLPSR